MSATTRVEMALVDEKVERALLTLSPSLVTAITTGHSKPNEVPSRDHKIPKHKSE